MSYQKIISAGNSRHIYIKFCLVKFFVSDHFGKSTVKDVELVRFYRRKRWIWARNIKIRIFGGKTKIEFLGYYASILKFLGHLDGGKACKIQNCWIFWQGNWNLNFGVFETVPAVKRDTVLLPSARVLAHRPMGSLYLVFRHSASLDHPKPWPSDKVLKLTPSGKSWSFSVLRWTAPTSLALCPLPLPVSQSFLPETTSMPSHRARTCARGVRRTWSRPAIIHFSFPSVKKSPTYRLLP